MVKAQVDYNRGTYIILCRRIFTLPRHIVYSLFLLGLVWLEAGVEKQSRPGQVQFDKIKQSCTGQDLNC